MANIMKVLIAYDGSKSARAMLNELERAGLPESVAAEVVTVAETWFPLPASIGGVETDFANDSLTGVSAARELAQEAEAILRQRFPTWTVGYAAAAGSPAGILLGQADSWKPDLIVLGSHGRTELGDLLLGNVAQKVASGARCSVRIARGGGQQDGAGVRLIVGVDGSPWAEAAITTIGERRWPAGSEVRIVNAVWSPPSPTPGFEGHETLAMQIADWVAQENARISVMIDHARVQLESKGLKVSVIIESANPKQLLIAEAMEWKADAIFIGARGHGRLERLLLGSVSSTIVERAPCSVEIVR
ncbi:MAG: universal stress protein [Acidobacteria bacterium]|nr:universal stress protein [Acidobacteriota bacterium]